MSSRGKKLTRSLPSGNRCLEVLEPGLDLLLKSTFNSGGKERGLIPKTRGTKRV